MPRKCVEYYSRIYPDAWKQTDQFRQDRGKKLPFWPDWCFLPLAGAFAIVSAEAERQGIDLHKNVSIINDVGIIAALAAWRVTQGVYRFDPDVYKAVIETPITGDIPHDIFFNMPEWCLYIETPGLFFLSAPLKGFFVHLEHDVGAGGRKELRFVFDLDLPESTIPSLISHVIHLGPWTLKECVNRALDIAKKQTKSYPNMELPDEATDVLKGIFTPLVSLLLYICSINSEIESKGRRPKRPQLVKTRKGPRLFAPNKPTTWDVGVRMGAALRQARNVSYAETEGLAEGKQRSGPRPHVRRAHWHGYWTGPKDKNQKYVLKWLNPILVGSGDIPVTIRPVN